jgi:hypothetical protein
MMPIFSAPIISSMMPIFRHATLPLSLMPLYFAADADDYAAFIFR